IVGGVVIAIGVGARQEIERIAAVIVDDRREFEALQDTVVPGAFEYARCDELVSFVKIRESAVGGEIGFVLGSEVTIEIGGGVPGLAVGVVNHGHKVMAETLLHLEGDTLVQGKGG